MSTRDRVVAVVTADVINSSRYSREERRKLDRVLRQAFADTERRFPKAIHTTLAFRITAGDEFQCVIADIAQAFAIVTYLRATAATGGLRPPVRFRASIGVGRMSTPKRVSSYEEDGPAFLKSRQGLDDMAKGRGPVRWTKLVTGAPELDEPADAVLCLADYVQQAWTVPQCEAIRWSLLGLTREEIGKRLRVAHQNVTKRLQAAGWPNFEVAATFLRRTLERASDTLKGVQATDAPR